jgi:hypothetical protein
MCCLIGRYLLSFSFWGIFLDFPEAVNNIFSTPKPSHWELVPWPPTGGFPAGRAESGRQEIILDNIIYKYIVCIWIFISSRAC